MLCNTHTVEHNYILPSSTVGIQLHVSALYVGHLQVVILLTEQLYEMCGGFFGNGWGGNELLGKLNHNLKMAHIQGRNM